MTVAPQAEAPPSGSKSWLFWAYLVLLVLLGFLLRRYQIAARPFHHDEGVNWYFLNQMKTLGYYPYSHENYHGPSFFYLSKLLVKILGESEVGIRASALACGSILVLLPVMLWKQFGRMWVLFASALVLSSPSLTFFARYAIHESLFLIGGMMTAFALIAWSESRSSRWIYWGFLGLAILVTTKETFIITLFCLGLAWIAAEGTKPSLAISLIAGSLMLVVASVQGLDTNVLAHPWGFLNAVQNDKLFHGCLGVLALWSLAAGARGLPTLGADLWRSRMSLSLGCGLFVLIVVLVYTACFFWSAGLSEMLAAVPQWWGRNDSDVGHHKSFVYYTNIFLRYEPFVLVAVALPAVSLVDWLILNFLPAERLALDPTFRRRSIFFGMWTLSSFLSYSFVKYKTPWLIVDITLPALLLLATWVDYVWKQGVLGRWGAILSTALIVAVHGESLASTNYGEPCWPEHPYCYVHTTKGMIDMVGDIQRYWEKRPNARVLIGVNGYWPLPYYLREKEKNLMYLANSTFDANAIHYDIMILELSENKNVQGWAKKYYRLNAAEEAYVYFRRSEISDGP